MRRKIREGGGFKNLDSNLKEFEKEVNVPLVMDDFKEALKNVNKSVGGEDLEHYAKWMKEFGSAWMIVLACVNLALAKQWFWRPIYLLSMWR